MKNFLLAFIVGFILVMLAFLVWSNTAPSECEMLANEYSATVSMDAREIIFNEGLDKGCFHE